MCFLPADVILRHNDEKKYFSKIMTNFIINKILKNLTMCKPNFH